LIDGGKNDNPFLFYFLPFLLPFLAVDFLGIPGLALFLNSIGMGSSA